MILVIFKIWYDNIFYLNCVLWKCVKNGFECERLILLNV